MNTARAHRALRRALFAAVAVLVMVTATVVAITRRTGPPARLDTGGLDVELAVPVAGRVTLRAELLTPPPGDDPAGGFPLVVVPGGWGQPATAYRLLARRLARAGYEVVVYAQRGQANSGGEIDSAGPATRDDVSSVIDWALRSTRADRRRIGMLGVSYGAGVALLAAARDPRIRAVVATSTWASLSGTLVQNGTPNIAALHELLDHARLDPALAAVRTDLTAAPQDVASRLDALSGQRSPLADVAGLNRNRPAIMIANAWEDRYFPPRTLATLYQRLTTPKRLELSGGDHGLPLYAAVLGRPDPTADDAIAWLDHYLRGRANGIDRRAPVDLRDVVTGTWRTYPAWPVAGAADVFDLEAPGAAGIGGTPATWSSSVTTGVDTAATSGTGSPYPPLQADLGSLPPRYSISWSGPEVLAPTQLTGSLDLRVRLASSSRATTVFVYVYDETTSGLGTLMSVTPYTASGMIPGTPRTLEIGLQPVAWTLLPGHRVTVVIDTVDPRYRSAAPVGSTVTFGSSASDPATLTVPLG